jgi:hypothetical protein
VIDGGDCQEECDCGGERDMCDVDLKGAHVLEVVGEEGENNKLSG